MRATWTILGKDLRLRLRDRTVVIYGFVAPFVLAFVLGLVFGDVDEAVTLDVAVAAPADAGLSGPLLDVVLPGLEQEGLVESTTVLDDREAVVRAVEEATADVGFVVLPDGPRGPAGIEVLESVDRGIAGSVATSIARGVVDEARTAVAAVEAAVGAGAQVDPVTVVEAVSVTPRVAETSLVASGTRPLDATTGVAAGIAVFFVLFAVGISATGLLEEERDGTLARLRTAPIRPEAVLASKSLLGFIVGTVSLATLAVATTVAMGADWGSPGRLALVIVAASAAAVGIVMAMTSAARTPEAASNGTAIVATVAGALGGSFFPVADEGALGVVARLTPHRWFLEGIEDAAGGAPIGEVLTDAGVLLLMAAVTGVIAAVRLRSRVAGS